MSTAAATLTASATEPNSPINEVRAAVQGTLAPGGYRIEWRGASPDRHAGGDAVRFRVGPAR